jgi:hypothetical protein
MSSMLATESTVIYLLMQFVIYFPTGYLILGKKFYSTPFVIKVPFYISLGLLVTTLMVSIVGIVYIGNPVMVLLSVGGYTYLLVRARKGLATIKDIVTRQLTCIRWQESLVHIVSILVFMFLIAYFSILASFMEWPFSHDAINHGLLTSLLIHNQKLQSTLTPIAPSQPWFEPFGFHIIAANVSILFEIPPGEAMLIFASAIMILICMLAYSLIYMTTRSIAFSPLGFVSCFYVYPFPNLERWLIGMYYTGTYPNLFSYIPLLLFIAFISIILDAKKGLFKTKMAMLISVISIGITYTPNIVLPLVYLLSVYSFRMFFYLRKRVVSASAPRSIQWQSIVRFRFIILALSIFLLSITLSITFPKLSESITQIGTFQQVKANYLGYALTSFDLAKDPVIPILTILNIALAGASLIKKIRRYLNAFFLLFSATMLLSTISPFSNYMWFILPTRLFPFLLLFDIIMVLTYVSDFDIFGRLIDKISPKYHASRYFDRSNIDHALKGLLCFVLLIAFFFNPFVSHLRLDQAKEWGFPNPDFHKNYDLLLWIHSNTNSSDLLMTDYSFTAQFLNSFSVKNMTATLWPDTASVVARTYDSQIAWERPDLIKDFVRKYDVKYIIVVSDSLGSLDPAPLGGDNLFYFKAFSADEYNKILTHMSFLKLVKKVGSSAVYRVLQPIDNQ